MQRYFPNTKEKKVTGIIIIPDTNPKRTPKAKKYEYIDNTEFGIRTFKRFAERENPQATHINFYSNANGSLLKQEKINQ